jgi:hypothetical protein
MSNCLKYFLNKNSYLISNSEHTTPLHSHLTVVIGDRVYNVLDKIHGFPISMGQISYHFIVGCPSIVNFSSNNVIQIGLICFDEISKTSFLNHPFSLPNPIMNFRICLFQPEYMCVQTFKSTDKDSPNVSLGCFKYRHFIEKFRKMLLDSSRQLQIQDSWRMFVHFLREIGYFDIFDINHFQSIVLQIFLRMFNEPNIISTDVPIYLFLSFIERLLSNNCWFMIVGGKYRQMMRRPSHEFIRLFLDPRYLPTVNFVSDDVVGIITPQCRCALISISTTSVIEIGKLSEPPYCDEELLDRVDSILHPLFGPRIDPDNINQDDIRELCRRQQQPERVDISCVPLGVLTVCERHFILFVFKMLNNIQFFIQRPDGTFEYFCPYFFLMLHLFSVNDIMNQLRNQFQEFSSIGPDMLVEALIREDCGFESIFDGSATREQVHMFFLGSVFGVILRQIICDFEGFPERLREHCSSEDKDRHGSGQLSSSLQQNQYVSHLRVIFETILGRLQGRDDLGQEIGEILSSLDRIVKFLTPVPLHSD